MLHSTLAFKMRFVAVFLLLCAAVHGLVLPETSIGHTKDLQARQCNTVPIFTRPASSQTVGRVSIRGTIDGRRVGVYEMNNFVTATVDAETLGSGPTGAITITIENRSVFPATIWITNNQDTRPSTPARAGEELRAPGVQGNVPSASVSRCVRLPRLDGTWYIEADE
ncbi:hypothetical protein ACHAQH_007519 [Verticillium albo-atrum]